VAGLYRILGGHKVKIGKTHNLPKPRVDAQELLEVEQEYLSRYFRSKQEIEQATSSTRAVPVSSRAQAQEISQSVLLYQPINRRERLQ
jgi:hypothetical protein